MWFKKKNRNRRLENSHVLDVKLRSDQVRAVRFRVAALVLMGGFAVLVIALTFWRGGEWLLSRLVYENQDFAIRNIEIQTDGLIAAEQLRRWARVKIGDNLLALDLAVVKRDLEIVPWIHSVTVERSLPNTIRLRIKERMPVAQIFSIRPRATERGYEQITYQIDETGFLMEPLNPRWRMDPNAGGQENLPVLNGLSASLLRPSRPIDSAQVRSAIRLVQVFEQSSMAGLVELRKIDLSIPEILQVSTDQGSEITFSCNNVEQQIRRWKSIYDFGLKNGKAISSLDLSVANNIPARWMEATLVPPPVKPLKTSRNRKKHV